MDNILLIFFVAVMTAVSGNVIQPRSDQPKKSEEAELTDMLVASDGFKISLDQVREALQLASRIDDSGLSHNPPLIRHAPGMPHNAAIVSTLPHHELYPKTFDEDDVYYFKDVEFLDDNHILRNEFDRPVIDPEPLWYYPARG